MKLISSFYKFIFASFVALSVHATPILVEIERLDFDHVVPLTGDCEMHYDTGVITDRVGSRMCQNDPVGTPGHYRLLVGQNQNFDIRVSTRLPENNDGITYTPVGKLTSDVEEVDIVADSFVTVNSGALGQIDIKFGGRLTVTNMLSGSLTYTLDDAVKISYEATP